MIGKVKFIGKKQVQVSQTMDGWVTSTAEVDKNKVKFLKSKSFKTRDLADKEFKKQVVGAKKWKN
jgi:hypothetical protein